MDFYTIILLFLVSIIATSSMTLFSYSVSSAFRELYKEPVLLAFVLKKFNINISSNAKITTAWILHYLIGLFFVVIYYMLWKNNIITISTLDTLIVGAVTGIVGIVGWVLLFKTSDYRPNLNFTGYYLQLFLAHLIFALTAAASFYLSFDL